MDYRHFDDLTRTMAEGMESRRAALRLLGASALAGLVAHLALGETEARRHGKRHKRQATLHDEKKRRRKKRRKPRHKPNRPSQPGGCSDDERKCPDGSCVPQATCCAGERACGAGTCVASGTCCPGEASCDDGSCVAAGACCPGAAVPTCGDCQAVACVDGVLQCQSTCSHEVLECCQGMCVNPCGGGWRRDPYSCGCECPPESVVLPDDTCCPLERACNNYGSEELTFCCEDGTICIAPETCS